MNEVTNPRLEKTAEPAPDRSAWYVFSGEVNGQRYAMAVAITNELIEDTPQLQAILESSLLEKATA